MKFIRLTNARQDIKGTTLYFNPDHITCVYDMDGIEGEKTFVYGGNPAQSWEVEETANQIMKMVNKSTIEIWDSKIKE
jgi:hypothetical protein